MGFNTELLYKRSQINSNFDAHIPPSSATPCNDVRFVVIIDPMDNEAYSVYIRHIIPTNGLDVVMACLSKNGKRKHKKHVQAWMCPFGEHCADGWNCPNLHVTAEGYAKKRIWCRPLTIQRLAANRRCSTDSSSPSCVPSDLERESEDMSTETSSQQPDDDSSSFVSSAVVNEVQRRFSVEKATHSENTPIETARHPRTPPHIFVHNPYAPLMDNFSRSVGTSSPAILSHLPVNSLKQCALTSSHRLHDLVFKSQLFQSFCWADYDPNEEMDFTAPVSQFLSSQ